MVINFSLENEKQKIVGAPIGLVRICSLLDAFKSFTPRSSKK